jgi:hypothetical protein
MKHTRSKNNGMKRHMRMLAIILVPVVALILGISALTSWAGEDEEQEFDVAELFFELNDTDGDLGIHALIDGDPWKELEIEDKRGRTMLEVEVKGRLRKQGLTEIFFESAEPTFDELPLKKFFRRFPAGVYEIEGETLEGDELESETELTHVMPAPAGNITVNGAHARPSSLEDECDEDNPPIVSDDVVIEWYPVTTSHPTIGESDPDIEIIRYQAVAEWEDDDENVFVSSIDLPAPEDTTVPMSVTIPSGFFRPGTEFKVEVLVREESYNQTAVESCPFEYE